MRDAGVAVARRVLEAHRHRVAVITDAERDLGVILVDVGGGTSDIAVFLDGAIAHTSAIPVGGNHVTRDLARLLRVSFEEAERLKIESARARADNVGEDEAVVVELADGSACEQVPLHLVAEIIEPRLEEIFTLVRNNVARAELLDRASAGVVLSGGGSQLPDTAEVASSVLDNLPVRIGSPRGWWVGQTPSPARSSPRAWAILAARDAESAPAVGAPGAGVIARLRRWIERVLPRA